MDYIIDPYDAENVFISIGCSHLSNKTSENKSKRVIDHRE